MGGAVIGTPILVTKLQEESSSVSRQTTPQPHCEVLINLSKDAMNGSDIDDYFHLLACKAEDNSSNKAIFQLVKQGEGEDKFKEVKSFDAKQISSVQVTITYRENEGSPETMNSSEWKAWEPINNKDLKESCTVNWQEEVEVHKLICGSSSSQTWSLTAWNR